MATDQTNVMEAVEGVSFDWDGNEYVIGPKCDDKSAPGSWRCIAHGEGFANNLQMWTHCDDERVHRIAWICTAHGPEVP